MAYELGHDYYRLALSAAERGDLSAAARLASCALSLEGARDKARRLLGLCLYELGDTETAANLLAECPGLAEEAQAAHGRTKSGLEAVKALVRQGKWRAALKAAESIPHQSVRMLNIRGCILAGAGRYVGAGRLFALAAEKDRGGRAASAYLGETARRVKSFWG